METLTICGTSNRGLVREENQDHFSVSGLIVQSGTMSFRLPATDPAFQKHGILCAVADGMGGHAGGALASRMALNHLLLDFLTAQSLNETDTCQPEWIHAAVDGAHQSLLDLALQDPAVGDMGTTLVGVILKPSTNLVFHAGDSRLYRYRDGFLNQMTRDHASALPTANAKPLLTNCLGGGRDSYCRVETQRDVSFRPGDRFLICSDGLSDMVELELLEDTLKKPDPIEDMVFSLSCAATEAGGLDNITVIIIGMD